MKRKILGIGQTALGITLPSKWYQKNKLEKGDEVDAKIENNDLVISTVQKDSIKKIEVNLDNINPFILRYLRFMGRLGFDEIVCTYSDLKLMVPVQEVIRDHMIGFEVVYQDNSKSVVKCLSEAKPEEFDNSLRRLFLVAKSMVEGIGSCMDSESTENLMQVRYLETTNNKLSTFCKRIINKTDMKYKDSSIVYYQIINNLEQMCDELRYLCDFLLMGENHIKNINNEVKNFYHEFSEIYVELTNSYLKKDAKKIIDYIAGIKYINRDKINEKYKLSEKDIPIFHYIITVTQLVGLVC